MSGQHQSNRRSRPNFSPAHELRIGNLARNVTPDVLVDFMIHEGVSKRSIQEVIFPRNESSEQEHVGSVSRRPTVLFTDEREVLRAASLLSGRHFRGHRLQATFSRANEMSQVDKRPKLERKYHSTLGEKPEPSQWGPPVESGAEGEAVSVVKEAPTLERSGALAKPVRTGEDGVDLIYEEPGDSCLPAHQHSWRMYVFKGDQLMESEGQKGIFYIARKSYIMFGRDPTVAHISLGNPSCSKQHAVLQFRKPSTQHSVVPYLFDLDSTNGSFLNGERVGGRKYIELRNKDVLRFGNSSREYVLVREEN